MAMLTAATMPPACPDTGWRYVPRWDETMLDTRRLRWVSRCGAYDLWYDWQLDTFVAVNGAGCYTDFAERDGNLGVACEWGVDDTDDDGVRPELPDMCLIYAAVAGFVRPPHPYECEEEDE